MTPTVETVMRRAPIPYPAFRMVRAGEDRLAVGERFPHSHEHDVCDGTAPVPGGPAHRGAVLAGDLGRCQLAAEARPAGGAEAALERAAGLRRDAERETMPGGDQDALDDFAPVQRPQMLDGAVAGLRDGVDGGLVEAEGIPQRVAFAERQVGHVAEGVGVTAENPLFDLAGAVAGLPAPAEVRRQRLAQLARCHPQEVLAIEGHVRRRLSGEEESVNFSARTRPAPLRPPSAGKPMAHRRRPVADKRENRDHHAHGRSRSRHAGCGGPGGPGYGMGAPQA